MERREGGGLHRRQSLSRCEEDVVEELGFDAYNSDISVLTWDMYLCHRSPFILYATVLDWMTCDGILIYPIKMIDLE
jgi:hypothetical protein